MAITTAMAILIGVGVAAVGTAAQIGTSLYTAAEEKSTQKKILADQNAKAAELEKKADAAKALASADAAEKLRLKRAAQTQTILTSPLGITDQASDSGTGKPTLLGGI